MSYETLCKGCFSEKGNSDKCPFCGFEEKKYVVPPYCLSPGVSLNNRYIVGKVLGSGGFGITYIAYDTKLECAVAIKEYLPKELALRTSDSITVSLHSEDYAKEFNHYMDAFIKEAKILAKFNSKSGIVSVQDIFKENGTVYIVMYYVDGITLEEYLVKNGNRLTGEKVVQILSGIMESLKRVHEEGVIHRDISPDNIYITADNEVKLLDFGAARYFIGDEKSTVSIVLKRGYAPLEQYFNKKENQGPWTDIYSIAATMYRAVTGVKPTEAVERVSQDDLKSPSQMGIHVPDYIESAIMKGLNIRYADRPKTLNEFIRLLQPVERTEIINRKVPAFTGGEKLSKRKRVLILAGLAAVLIAIPLIIMFLNTGNNGKPDTAQNNITTSGADNNASSMSQNDLVNVDTAGNNAAGAESPSANTFVPFEAVDEPVTSAEAETTPGPEAMSEPEATPDAASEPEATQRQATATPNPTPTQTAQKTPSPLESVIKVTQGISVVTGPDPTGTICHTISMDKEKLPAGLPESFIVAICCGNDAFDSSILAEAASVRKDGRYSFKFEGRTGEYYNFASNSSYIHLLLFDNDMNLIGYFIYQVPKAGQQTSSEVSYTVPQVTNVSIKDAISAIVKAGFTYNIEFSDETDSSNLVKGQSPAGGTKVQNKCQITLYVSVNADLSQILNASSPSPTPSPISSVLPQPDSPIYNRNAILGSTAPSHVRSNIDDIYVVSVKPSEGLTDGDEITMTVTFEYNLISQESANINVCVNNGDDSKSNIENSRLLVPKGRGTYTLPFPTVVKYWSDGSGAIVSAYISKFNNDGICGSNWVTIPVKQKQ